MSTLFVALLAWLPAPLALIGMGAVALFIIYTVLHLIRFVLDLIPFL